MLERHVSLMWKGLLHLKQGGGKKFQVKDTMIILYASSTRIQRTRALAGLHLGHAKLGNIRGA